MSRSVQIESSREAAEADQRYHTRQRLQYAEGKVAELRQKLDEIFYDLADEKQVTLIMGERRITVMALKKPSA